ncbi:MAG TPA: ABC transporter ATP-binding protein [Candidatus Binatia bacterium]|nr:ABC transporter ATP-binding protein [Candidatus Binatia bacterium]
MTPLVALRDVRLRYAGGFTLEVAELDVRPAEVLAVIGPNGSGKSTLLRVLGLLERPDAGVVSVGGRAVDARDGLAERRRMVTVFQDPLLADTTVAANAALGLGFRGIRGSAAERRVRGWLERFGVAALAERPARTLSGGEAQRVALARALVLEPEVLLLDEPFASLDAPSRTALIGDLGAVLRQERVATVLVTHDRGEAQALADRVAVLIGGRVRQLADTVTVFQAPASEEVARFVGVETIVSGRVLAREGGLTRVRAGDRTLEVAAAAEPGARVRLAIRPEDVTLVVPPMAAGGSSARNVLAGVITQVAGTEAGVRVVVDCGFPLVATVTRRSAADLGLAAGMAITAVFKASAPHLLPGGAMLDTPTCPRL